MSLVTGIDWLHGKGSCIALQVAIFTFTHSRYSGRKHVFEQKFLWGDCMIESCILGVC